MENLACRSWLHLIVLIAALLVGCSVSEAHARSALAGAQAVTPSSPPGVQQSAQLQTATDTLDRSPNRLFNPHGMALGLEKVADGIEMPTLVTHAGDGSQRLFVVEKHGVIRLLPEGDVFLDISDRVNANQWEQGLLGLAFHPRVQENAYFYVYYTNHADDAVLARFQQAPDGRSAEPDSEYILFRQEKPTALHNGGMLAFGPDWVSLPHVCLSQPVPCISTFGEDEAGELYVAYISSEEVYRLTVEQHMIDWLPPSGDSTRSSLVAQAPLQ